MPSKQQMKYFTKAVYHIFFYAFLSITICSLLFSFPLLALSLDLLGIFSLESECAPGLNVPAMAVFGELPRHTGLGLSRLSDLVWVVVGKPQRRKWKKSQIPLAGPEQTVASRRTGVKGADSLGQLRKGLLPP